MARLPRARTGEEVIANTAAILALRGFSEQDAVAKLMRQYNFISEEDAANYFLQGELAVARAAKIMAMFPEGERPEVGTPLSSVANPREAKIRVTIVTPGEEDQYKEIRIRVTPGMTDQELYDQVNAIVDDWLNKYDKPGRAMFWEVTTFF